MTKSYYIGLMSGTSLDGVDAVLVESKQNSSPRLAHAITYPIPENLRKRLIDITNPHWLGSLATIGSLHQELGRLFADSTSHLLLEANITKKQIKAIGSHGQTVWHKPEGEWPFSMQLGDANLISELTGITTIADFRSRDIAAGGQGAPLVPAFHQSLLSSPTTSRVVLNIGGIANITILPPTNSKLPTSGFDTGPGNGILDAWIRANKKKKYDHNGDWARSGNILPEALELLYKEPYFSSPSPKSTGKELFNLSWLEKNLGKLLYEAKPENIQATLVELTAQSISENIPSHCGELYLCGGGIHNKFLIERLQALLPTIKIYSSQSLGIDPDWMEAIAFAWLAQQTIEGEPSNLPGVTGAKGFRILGATYPGHHF